MEADGDEGGQVEGPPEPGSDSLDEALPLHCPNWRSMGVRLVRLAACLLPSRGREGIVRKAEYQTC